MLGGLGLLKNKISFLAQPSTVILLLQKGEENFWSSCAEKTARSQEVVGMLSHCCVPWPGWCLLEVPPVFLLYRANVVNARISAFIYLVLKEAFQEKQKPKN